MTLRYTLVYMDLDPEEWIVVCIGVGFVILVCCILGGLL